jgi:hypothetical protein
MHNAFIDAMLDADIHLICTMRAKEEHVMENVVGKEKPQVRSIGIEPIQRKYMQYEFDVVGSLDVDNNLSVVKTRCSELHGSNFYRAGKQIADTMLRWLDGIPAPQPQIKHAGALETTPISAGSTNDGPATEQQMQTIARLQSQLGLEPAPLDGLSFADCAQLIKDYSHQINARRKSA